MRRNVTPADVWRALAEIPDPEIPVISLVELGVIKEVAVDGACVTVDFTPTFMGCPALDVMTRLIGEAIVKLEGVPEVRVVLDDSWSTDRITAAGREKLRAAGFAPPPLRADGPVTLVQLERGTHAVPGAGRPRRDSRTSSARRPAARSATATPAASRSSSSRLFSLQATLADARVGIRSRGFRRA